METFEMSVNVTFIVEADSEEEARDQIESTLSDIAHDWGSIY